MSDSQVHRDVKETVEDTQGGDCEAKHRSRTERHLGEGSDAGE